jgi:predicted cupin superfamily sugar epimerase
MSETLTADEVIALFGLKPHPEGGHYRETFRDALGHADRAHSTAILFLLKDGEVARWHKVDAAEHWHFHAGCRCCSRSGGDARREVQTCACDRAGACRAKRAQSRCMDAGRLFDGAGLRFFGFRDGAGELGTLRGGRSPR